MILLLDNYDSFTYNLVDYFAQLGKKCCVKKNDVRFEELTKYDYEAIVLSPGPGRPKSAGILFEVLEYYHDKLPILGICLGHQAIGEFFGATLEKARKPMHGKISEISHQNKLFFHNFNKKIKIVRYHSLILNDVPDNFEILATTENNELMAMEHKSLPISSLQFHPEAALTEGGLQMLENWLMSIDLLN